MKRILIGCLALSVIGFVLVGWITFGDRSSFQLGLAAYEGLPHTASDITIYQEKNISGVYVADFKIAEADFVSFATDKGWALQPITGSAAVFQANAFQEARPNDKKEITDGLYYSKRAPNGGGVTVAYDRKGAVDILITALDNMPNKKRIELTAARLWV